MDDRFHKTAAVGNAVALMFIVLIVVSGRSAFAPAEPRPGGARSGFAAVTFTERNPGTARRLMLVVIDGLRADTAFDPQRMPVLNRLAGRGPGARTTAHVESLLPCSIAGIVSLISGDVLPPAAFLSDFRAEVRDEGGVLQAVHEAGGAVFVAGPILWTDLYAPWITAAEVDETFGQADRRLLAATRRYLAENEPGLVVLHLSRPDVLAHRYGTDSPQYHAAVRWCDDAVGQLLLDVDSRTAVVVTSDHGNTTRGGHAGPEPSVLATPVVTYGPGLPNETLPEISQTMIPRMISAALGVESPKRSSAPVEANRPAASGAWMRLVPILLALLCGLRIASGLPRVASGHRHAFAMNAAVWVALTLMLGGYFFSAMLLCLLVLAATASAVPRGTSPALVTAGGVGGMVAASRVADAYVFLSYAATIGTVTAFISLILLAAVAMTVSPMAAWWNHDESWAAVSNRTVGSRKNRVWEGWIRRDWPALLIGAGFALTLAQFHGAAVFLLAFFLSRTATGWLPSGDGRGGGGLSLDVEPDTRVGMKSVAGGCMTGVVLALLYRGFSGTVSLSSIDVSLAARLLQGRVPIAVAVVAVVAAQAIPVAGLLLGLRRWLVSAPSSAVTFFAAGLAAVLVGQAAAALVLVDRTGDQVTASLALGLAVHVMIEAVFLFLGLGILLLMGPRWSGATGAVGRDSPPRLPVRGQLKRDRRGKRAAQPLAAAARPVRWRHLPMLRTA